MKTTPKVWLIMIVFLFTLLSLQGTGQDKNDTPPPPPPPPPLTEEIQVPPPPPPPPQKLERKIIRDLPIPDLTSGQQEELKREDLNHTRTMTPLENQLREHHAHLVTLLSTDDLNMKEVNQTISHIGSLDTQMLQEQVNHDRSVREILTPDQRVVYDTYPKHYLKRK